jgi:hypothetical protein
MKRPRFIWYSRVFPKRYLDFVRISKLTEKGRPPYTRNQWRFANYLLKNEKTYSQMGNMEQVFEDVRGYFRLKRFIK